MSLNWKEEISDADKARSIQGLPSEESMVLYPSARSLLESQTLFNEDKPFVKWLEGDTIYSLSYTKLHDLAKQAANYLRSKGIKFGHRVMLNPRNDLETVAKQMGLWLEGAVALPTTGEKPQTIPDSFDPFPDEDFFELISQQSTDYELLQKAKLSDDMIIFIEQNDEAIALSHNNVLSSALSNTLHLDISENDVIVCPISMGESFGFIAGLVTATYAGAVFAPCEPEPKEMCKLAAETNAKWMLVNNSLLKILLENAHEYRPLLPNGLQFLTPEDGVSSEMVLNVLDNLGCQTITGFFSTECSSFATLIPADLNDGNYRSLFTDNTTLPIGGGLQTTEADIHDNNGSPVQDKEFGELVIRGHTVMQRYVGNESGTDEAFKNGWLHTGREGYKITIDENNVKFFLRN
jgi:acyl-CoA synthetase (AMP-forming)/AMP-acid ligase II